jgi:hypothetical protein
MIYIFKYYKLYDIAVLYIFKLKWLCYQILLRLYLLDNRNVKILVRVFWERKDVSTIYVVNVNAIVIRHIWSFSIQFQMLYLWHMLL